MPKGIMREYQHLINKKEQEIENEKCYKLRVNISQTDCEQIYKTIVRRTAIYSGYESKFELRIDFKKTGIFVRDANYKKFIEDYEVKQAQYDKIRKELKEIKIEYKEFKRKYL